MATVVGTLFGVAARTSTPAPASVITASVVSGTISDTEPTNVVLPTPKPPATTIFAEVVGFRSPSAALGLEPAKPTEHPLKEINGRLVPRDQATLMNQNQTHARHVADQHPGHAEREPEVGGDLGHRPGVGAQPADRPVLGEHGRVAFETS